MISSINNEYYYLLYQNQNVSSYSGTQNTQTSSDSYLNSVETASAAQKEETPPPPPPEESSASSEEEYSAEEHMEMMSGGTMPPEISNASSASETDTDALSEYDTDGDGVLSAAEYAAMMEDKGTEQVSAENGIPSYISSIDADSDGTISSDEYEEMISQLGITNALSADEFFAQYDVNEDGEISVDEMPEPGTVSASVEETDDEALNEYDTNEDGVLSAAEYAAMMEDQRAEQVLAENGIPGGISSIDADSDGTISSDEYEEMISQMDITNALSADEFFAQYDVNEDGEISADEMPEPGTINAAVEETETSEDEETLTSAEYQQLFLKAMQAYNYQYESMFDAMDGTMRSNEA